MHILVIPDKFKDSLTAGQVVKAISRGIIRCNKTYHISKVIASDGGDGFLDAIYQVHPDLKFISVYTVNPFGKSITANYLFNSKNHTAYIELAQASGFALLNESDRDCSRTSTYGTGLQIKHAIQKAAKNIYIGLGGSATNDGGTGILRALGFKFLDKKNVSLATNGDNLSKIVDIKIPKQGFKEINFFTVNDVNNLLLGKQGATYTYARQKGAKEKDLPLLEKGMNNLFQRSKIFNPNLKDTSGFGAAGGSCFGLNTFLNAKIISGTDFLFRLNKLDKILKNNNIDLIITGEGKIDKQTLHGKFIAGITSKANAFKIPVIAICGISTLNKEAEKKLGANIYPIKTENISLKESMENAAKLIENKTFIALQEFNTKPLT
ncbi:MAG: glycerate kinase [Flavobacteriaceae bacterium]|nr:glycerate kinase [Flavobacteriaceae bacterium]